MSDIAPLYISPSRAAAKLRAQHFAEDVADGLRTEANQAIVEAYGLILSLRGAGAGNISIGALKDALTDCFGDIQGGINRTLDNEGVTTDWHQLDLSELGGA